MINGRTRPNWDGSATLYCLEVVLLYSCRPTSDPTYVSLLDYSSRKYKNPEGFTLRNCQTLFTVGSFIKGFSFFLIFVGERTPRFIVSHLERRLSVLTGWGGMRPDSYLKSQARPKSDILTCPCSSNRIFAGLRSRYTI